MMGPLFTNQCLGELIRIKELSLINNPLKDNRLKKMTPNKPAKTLLDYISKNGIKMSENSTSEETGGKGKGKSGKKSGKESSKEVAVDDLCDKMSVLGVSNQFPEVVVDLSGKNINIFQNILKGCVTLRRACPFFYVRVVIMI